MYKLLKEAGSYTSNVTLINTDTGNAIILGRLSTTILDLIKKDGYTIDSEAPEHLSMRDRWELKISKEVAEELAKTAMPMRRPPKRPKKEKVIIPSREVETPVEETKEEVNALDVLLGFAHYNTKGSGENE